MDQESANEIPERLDEIIDELGVFVPPDENPASAVVFERMLDGHCATCGAELGENTFAIIGQPIGTDKVMAVMLFCGGACMSDMQVLGWMQTEHDGMVQAIKFRGGQVDADGPEN